MMILNGTLLGKFYIALFDENSTDYERGKAPVPFSFTEFPMNFFEPFKPINIQLKLPLAKSNLDQDIDLIL